MVSDGDEDSWIKFPSLWKCDINPYEMHVSMQASVSDTAIPHENP